MDNKERIERLRIEALEAQLTELQANYDKLNDFEQSQCVALLTKLNEKDKQLAAAVEIINQVNDVAVGAIEYGPYQDGEEAKIFFRIERMTRRGPQEAGEGGG